MTLGSPANPCICRDSCSRGRQLKPLLFFLQNKTTTHELLLSILKTTLGCRKQPADSQIASYREKQCSHKTPGPPPASLLSIQSPSSPRRRSSEGGRRWGATGGEAKKKNRGRLKRGRWSLCYESQPSSKFFTLENTRQTSLLQIQTNETNAEWIYIQYMWFYKDWLLVIKEMTCLTVTSVKVGQTINLDAFFIEVIWL